eukprot:GAFH01005926.1.p2 GENE.GAFH01005926.1~~GAFH01005926.1.p2  ORF type:complete len:175 (+),score=36.46 GAFH01005926.1:30-527(+)
MANQSEKRVAAKNASRMFILRCLWAAFEGFYFLVIFLKYLFSHKLPGFWSWFMVAVANVICMIMFVYLRHECEAGKDLADSKQGLSQYFHDILYVTWFVQVMSLLSNKFWLVLLVIPGYALYKAITFCKKARQTGPELTPEQQELAKKKQERSERRSEQRRQKWR